MGTAPAAPATNPAANPAPGAPMTPNIVPPLQISANLTKASEEASPR
jgi:hypothetical protein